MTRDELSKVGNICILQLIDTRLQDLTDILAEVELNPTLAPLADDLKSLGEHVKEVDNTIRFEVGTIFDSFEREE